MPEKNTVAQSRSLLEQLPDIVREGKQLAERIMEGLDGRNRVGLQTREFVVPAKDSATKDFDFLPSGRSRSANRLIYGDNLLAMAALLAGDEEMPSLRGGIDLIYIDPPFDSKTDYRTKITLPGDDVEQKPTVMEQFAYSDTWAEDTASYLAMIGPRLCLMRELLSDRGSIYVHLDWHVGHYVKIALDDIFGKDNFLDEISWWRSAPVGRMSAEKQRKWGMITGNLFIYGKTGRHVFNQQRKPLEEHQIEAYSKTEGQGKRI